MSQNHFLNAYRTAITVAEAKQVFLPASCPAYTPVDFLISSNVPPTEVSYSKEPQFLQCGHRIIGGCTCIRL